MREIQYVITIIRESDYFTPWANVLLDDAAVREWKMLLTNHKKDYRYTDFGEKLHKAKVPFVIITEYLDEVFRYLDHHALDTHHIKNMIARAFLNEKLKSDSEHIAVELNRKLLDTLEKNRDLINAHLRWMQAFIDTIIGKEVDLELDPAQCDVGQWLLEVNPDLPHIKITEIHKNLHSMAHSAIRMYHRADYAYFLLLYNDILTSSYQTRDLIMHIYFTKRLASIYRDPLTDLPNYFQIREEIETCKKDNDLKSNTITKYEVLMRIEGLNGNILEPIEFLEHLQGMYIYPEITKLMIQKAFDVFKDNNYDFSINLSYADVVNPDTERFIIAIIKRYPNIAQRCTFELLENEAIQNPNEILDFFDLLNSYGVKIALDDFGVGYINYDTIFKLNIDYIKIDGFLTQSFLTDHKSLVLMESIIVVAKELNVKIITEYIDSKELLDLVRSMGIDYAQGYYIGKPSPDLLP